MTRDPRIKAAARHALLVAGSPSLVHRMPGWKKKRAWGIHLFAADGRHIRSWIRVEPGQVLTALIEASRDAPGFAGRLAEFRKTLRAAPLSAPAVDVLMVRFRSNHAQVRQAAVGEAVRLGAPAYRALKPLIGKSRDPEVRRLVAHVVARLEPLAKLARKRPAIQEISK